MMVQMIRVRTSVVHHTLPFKQVEIKLERNLSVVSGPNSSISIAAEHDFCKLNNIMSSVHHTVSFTVMPGFIQPHCRALKT